MSRRPGPPRKPVELTILEGNPGRRRRTDAPPAGKLEGIPEPPAGLEEAGRAAWIRYWEGGKAWLSKGDYDALLRACRLTDRAARIEAAIEEEGFLVRNARTKRSAVHSAFNHLLGVYKAIADLERGAGLPATERSRVTARQSTGDEIDEWMKGTGS